MKLNLKILVLHFLCLSYVYSFRSDEDTVVIEAGTDDDEGVRLRRQFPFQFPNWPNFPLIPSRPSASCYALSGEEGECVTLKQCFPILYSLEEGQDDTIQNPNLADMLRNSSGPCGVPVMSNYFFFKEDAAVRQNFICCSQNKRPSLFPPLKPRPLPPTGIKFTTQKPGGSFPNPFPPLGVKLTTRKPGGSFPNPFPPLGVKLTTRKPDGSFPNPLPPLGVKLTTRKPGGSFPNPFPPTGVKLTTQKPGGSFPKPLPPTGVKLTTQKPGGSFPKPPTAPTQAPKPGTVTPSGSQKIDTPSSCGIPRVVGGVESAKGRHPWIVALTNNGRQFCGGSLISKHFVLTAAHCVSHMRAADISRIRVHLGEHTLGVGENTEQFEKVTRVLYHRGFSHQTLHNDLALLKLESPARETQYIQSVCLSQDTRNLKDTVATLAGWGQVIDGGSQATTLREVNMQIWSLEACSAKYGRRAPAGIVSSMVCAGSAGKDACRGDSGGPLIIRNSRNAYEQIGIVSWGIGCGSYPGVYTKVSAFLPWIDKNRVI